MTNVYTQPDHRPDFEAQDFEYLAIITQRGRVSEAIPFASYEDAKECLILTAYEIDGDDVPTLKEANENSSNHYSIWKLDSMGGRYEDVT